MKNDRHGVIAGAWVALARHSTRIDINRVVSSLESESRLPELGKEAFVGLGLSARLAAEVVSEPDQMMKCEWVTACASEYPKALLDLPHPPAVIWHYGDRSLLRHTGVAVVGSRSCTSYGRSVAKSVAATVTAGGGVVVSGGARGIDQAAHDVALKKTIVVLGCGILHPSASKWVRWVTDNGGMLLSEFHPNQPPTRWSFPQRNRIIAALSLGTVVVEAGIRSGASITARRAVELNREVFAVPGRIDAPASQGTNRLIASGANCLVSTGEIIELLAKRVPDSQRIASSIAQPATVGAISAKLALSIAETCQWLSLLETSGAVVRLQGDGTSYQHIGEPVSLFMPQHPVGVLPF